MQPRTLIGTALASIAIAVPAAQAQAMPVEGTDVTPTQSVAVTGQHPYQALANQANEQQHTVVADVQQSAVRPDDRGGIRGVEQPQAPVATVSHPSGFDWREFGLGGAAVALALLALLGTRRIREITRHTPAKPLRTS